MLVTLDCNHNRLKANKQYQVSEIGPDWVKIRKLYVPIVFLNEESQLKLREPKNDSKEKRVCI